MKSFFLSVMNSKPNSLSGFLYSIRGKFAMIGGREETVRKSCAKRKEYETSLHIPTQTYVLYHIEMKKDIRHTNKAA